MKRIDMMINGVPISRFCRNLVAELCDGSITKQQFTKELSDRFPKTGSLFEYHRAKLQRERLQEEGEYA